MNNMKHINLALSFYGVKEIQGKRNNKTIVDFIKDIGYPYEITDEVAWCSAFVNWVASKSDLPTTCSLTARSWLKVGEKIDVGSQKIGDVVVFWRGSPNGWQGHVGFYIGENDTHIFVLGGNQSNQVKISEYTKKRLLGFRRLT